MTRCERSSEIALLADGAASGGFPPASCGPASSSFSGGCCGVSLRTDTRCVFGSGPTLCCHSCPAPHTSTSTPGRTGSGGAAGAAGAAVRPQCHTSAQRTPAETRRWRAAEPDCRRGACPPWGWCAPRRPDSRPSSRPTARRSGSGRAPAPAAPPTPGDRRAAGAAARRAARPAGDGAHCACRRETAQLYVTGGFSACFPPIQHVTQSGRCSRNPISSPLTMTCFFSESAPNFSEGKEISAIRVYRYSAKIEAQRERFSMLGYLPKYSKQR